VIQTARVPVLVRGGGKANDLEVLRRSEQLIAQGAAGLVYGRNIIQHSNPSGMTKALMAIVHKNAKAEEAAKRYLSA
jgi:fructose-bisphosphate aldolase, class I